MNSNRMPMEPTPVGPPKIDTSRDNRKQVGSFNLNTRKSAEISVVEATEAQKFGGTALPNPSGPIGPFGEGDEYRWVEK